jgi:hypothetical protein
MANRNQPDRWEARLLAAAMAVAGAPFLFDKLGSLVRSSIFSFSAILQSTPVLLVAVGAILLLADQNAVTAVSNQSGKGDQHEL